MWTISVSNIVEYLNHLNFIILFYFVCLLAMCKCYESVQKTAYFCRHLLGMSNVQTINILPFRIIIYYFYKISTKFVLRYRKLRQHIHVIQEVISFILIYMYPNQNSIKLFVWYRSPNPTLSQQEKPLKNMTHRLFDLSMVVFHQNFTNKKCLFFVSLSIHVDHKRGFTTTSVNQKQCDSFLSMAWARKIFVHTSHICSVCICKTKSNSEKRVTTARLTYPIQLSDINIIEWKST